MTYRQHDLSYEWLGIPLENPFILSAAPPTDELDIARDGLAAGWAGVVLKTTSVEGNPVHLKYPMMSSFGTASQKVWGLGNIDLISQYHIDEVCDRVVALKQEFPSKMIAASIMGSRKEDWQSLVWQLRKVGVDLIECSFSCPQGSMGEAPGRMLAQSVEATEKVARWVKEAAEGTPVLIKITPQVTDIVEVARALKRAGVDGVTASNSVPALMGIDIETLEPLPSIFGAGAYSGMTGRAIMPLTLRTVAEIARSVDITISGNGGAYCWRDAVELMAVGASNVQFCTLPMHFGFGVIRDLTSGFADYLDRQGFAGPMDVVGRALSRVKAQEELIVPHSRANVDLDVCVRCGNCFRACRDGAHRAIVWDSEKRLPAVDTEKCVGCAQCMQVCPVNAIDIREEFEDHVHTFAHGLSVQRGR